MASISNDSYKSKQAHENIFSVQPVRIVNLCLRHLDDWKYVSACLFMFQLGEAVN